MKINQDKYGTYYYPTYAAARAARDELIRVQDATPEARVNSFGRGYAIQERRGGKYWGEVSHQCPSGEQFNAGGWI
jgi:hypothetical protein